MTDLITQLSLSDYKIVYSYDAIGKTEELAAYELQAALEEMGTTLGIATDSGSVSTKSILVGDTAATVGNMPTGNNYSVSIDTNGRIQIAAGSYYGYRAAIDYLTSNTVGGIIPADIDHSADASISLMTAPTGALRVMFYNLYGYSNAGGPLDLRQNLQIDMIKSYAPDVIGFQEYVKASHDSMTAKLTALGYAEVPSTRNSSDKVNDTPIFYKSSEVTLEASGYFLYTEDRGISQACNNNYTKSLSWAVFTEKESGKQFTVVNTHLMYNADENDDGTKEDHTLARQENVKELLDQIGNIPSQYASLPIILGGDLNCSYTTAPFNDLVSGGFTWMKNAPNVSYDSYGYGKEIATYSTTDKIYTEIATPPTTGYGIDHALYSGNVTVKNYLTVTDRIACIASDHCPKLADIILN